MQKITAYICLGIYYLIANKIPHKLGGNNLRRLLLKPVLSKCGRKSQVLNRVYFGSGSRLSLGDQALIGDECRIEVGAEVTIGARTQIGPRTMIITGNHNFKSLDTPFSQQGSTYKPVHIGSDVWIGANVTILPGITIGEGTVVGAGAVVTKDVKPFYIVAGNPAKTIGRRGEE